MAAAHVSEAHLRISLDSHIDDLHAFIADWGDDDALFNLAGDDSTLARRTPSTHSACEAAQEPNATLSASAVSSRPAVRSPPSDAETLTDARSASSPSPESDSSAFSVRRATSLPPLHKTKPSAPRKKRVLPKDEIARLRDQSKVLETQLLALREYWKSAPRRIRNNGSSGKSARARAKHNRAREPAWQDVAAHERELLTASEAQNAALRTKYELNRKLARALRKLLTKRTAPPTVFDRTLYIMPQCSPQQVFAASSSDFTALLEALEPMHDETARIDALLASRVPLALDAETLAFRDWRIESSSTASLRDMYLELVDVYVLPFALAQVDVAMRQQHFHGHHTTPGHTALFEFFERSGDSTMRQVIYAYKNAHRQGYVRDKGVSCFVSTPTVTVVASVARIEPVDERGVAVADVLLREQKWVVVRSEDSSADELDSQAMSRVSAYSKITCERVAGEYAFHWTPAMLHHSMVPMWNASLANTRGRLESSLIELSTKTDAGH